MNRFRDKYLQVDLARSRVFNKDEMSDLLLFMERAGYNGLALYLEGAFALETVPGIIRHGVMTPDDAEWLVNESKKHGINVLPMTNVFGHMEQFVDREQFNYLSDQGKNQVDFTSSEAEEFAMAIVSEYARHFKTSTVHIGADETELTEDTRPLYAQFLSKICRKLLDSGITPAIWSDMLWMHQEMVTDIPRETIIYDWNYYGHRPDSLKYWKEQGFENVYVCPSDQSWEGFITCYRTCGYLKALLEPDVALGEVEAFIVDAFEAGTPGACLTTWEHRFGSPFWAQMVPIARAGLYMSGQWSPEKPEEDAVENVLFGHNTPYTKITNIIREYCQAPLFDIPSIRSNAPRYALFLKDSLITYLIDASKLAPRILETWNKGLSLVEPLLSEWKPDNSFEERCKVAIQVVVSAIEAAALLVQAASEAHEIYHSASLVQFQNKERCSQLLELSAKKLDSVVPAFARLSKCLKNMTDISGHAPYDSSLVNQRDADVSWLADTIRSLATDMPDPERSVISIPSWPRLVRKAILDEPVWSYI